MSADDEFEQFLRSADAIGEPTVDDALRVKARLGANVSWRRDVPAPMASALRTPGLVSGVSRFGLRSRFVKLAALAIVVAGLSATTHSMVGSPGGTTGPTVGARNGGASAMPSAAAGNDPQGDPGTAPSEERNIAPIPVPTIDDPAKLPAARPAPSPAKKIRRSGTLDAEVALLAETNAALQSKEPSLALALVDRHAREFPRGVLGPEFEAQRVLALAALGRSAEACALAARFLSAYPSSPLAPEVRSSCNESDR